MKVSKGKTVYYDNKKFKPGSEISDSVAELVGLNKKPKPEKPAGAGRGSGGSGGGGKPGDK